MLMLYVFDGCVYTAMFITLLVEMKCKQQSLLEKVYERQSCVRGLEREVEKGVRCVLLI